MQWARRKKANIGKTNKHLNKRTDINKRTNKQTGIPTLVPTIRKEAAGREWASRKKTTIGGGGGWTENINENIRIFGFGSY